MEKAEELINLLHILIHVSGRAAFPEEKVRGIVMPPGASAKQITAYNLCDGSRTQAQVARAAKINQGNFSRTMARWLAEGVLFRVGYGREARLLHLYPLLSPARGGHRKE
jgi:hypothetical protein